MAIFSFLLASIFFSLGKHTFIARGTTWFQTFIQLCTYNNTETQCICQKIKNNFR